MDVNIGKKIKGFALVLGVIEALSSVITGIVIMATDEDLIGIGLITIVAGVLLTSVTCLLMYGFGELIDDVKEIKNKLTADTASSQTEIRSGTHSFPAGSHCADNIVTSKKKHVPYRCKECGQEGPYIGSCPNCGASAIKYE